MREQERVKLTGTGDAFDGATGTIRSVGLGSILVELDRDYWRSYENRTYPAGHTEVEVLDDE